MLNGLGLLLARERSESGSDTRAKPTQSSGSPSHNAIKPVFYSDGSYAMAYLMIAD